MKKLNLILLLGAITFLVSCAPSFGNDEEVLQNEEDSPVERSIVPANRLDGSAYRMILPYSTSEARGVIVNQLANRLDVDEMEQGLRRHSTEVFDPEQLYFREGRFLSRNTVLGWIEEMNPDREDDWDKEDHEANPRVFSHILEQNYLQPVQQGDSSTVELAGVSIGIALKSVYRFEAPRHGDSYSYDISMDEMLERGYEIADTIIERMREMEGLEEVPILVGLYREESHSSPVPGNYVTKGLVPAGENTVNSWEPIDEEYVLFPSNEARDKYLEDSELFNSFGQEIADFFPNYVGAIGEGYYVDGELRQLSIEVPIEFHGKAEVIGFTQFAYGLVDEIFHNYYGIELQITSSHGVESLIYRNAREETSTVHILN